MLHQLVTEARGFFEMTAFDRSGEAISPEKWMQACATRPRPGSEEINALYTRHDVNVAVAVAHGLGVAARVFRTLPISGGGQCGVATGEFVLFLPRTRRQAIVERLGIASAVDRPGPVPGGQSRQAEPENAVSQPENGSTAERSSKRLR
jgi:hypothetical protein